MLGADRKQHARNLELKFGFLCCSLCSHLLETQTAFEGFRFTSGRVNSTIYVSWASNLGLTCIVESLLGYSLYLKTHRITKSLGLQAGFRTPSPFFRLLCD